jgi:hypothetical protein
MFRIQALRSAKRARDLCGVGVLDHGNTNVGTLVHMPLYRPRPTEDLDRVTGDDFELEARGSLETPLARGTIDLHD